MKLTKPQEINLKLLIETFGTEWFTEMLCMERLPKRVNRIRFVLETLYRKCVLTRELSPKREFDFEFYQYKVTESHLLTEGERAAADAGVCWVNAE